MYDIIFSSVSAKKLKKFDHVIRQRIEVFLDQKLSLNPSKHSIPLVNNQNLFRARIGDYRIIFEMKNNKLLILILDIDHRSKIYK